MLLLESSSCFGSFFNGSKVAPLDIERGEGQWGSIVEVTGSGRSDVIQAHHQLIEIVTSVFRGFGGRLIRPQYVDPIELVSDLVDQSSCLESFAGDCVCHDVIFLQWVHFWLAVALTAMGDILSAVSFVSMHENQ